MKVTYSKVKNENKKNRIEFWINNFDYEDGNDYLSKIFCEEFGMTSEEKVDYIYFSVIRLHLDNVTYELMWHEDIGNIIYSTVQEMNVVNTLEQRIKVVLSVLNQRLEIN